MQKIRWWYSINGRLDERAVGADVKQCDNFVGFIDEAEYWIVERYDLRIKLIGTMDELAAVLRKGGRQDARVKSLSINGN